MYQQAEQWYLQKIADIDEFAHTVSTINNVTDLASQAPKPHSQALTQQSDALALINTTTFNTDSPWLKKALNDPQLATDYHTLTSLDLLYDNVQKQHINNQWLKDTLVLNTQRQAKVIEQQKQLAYQDIIKSLNTQAQRIVEQIEQAQAQQDGKIFANQRQQQWLNRINDSQKTLEKLAGQRNTDDEQLRLDRIKGVLHWQLQSTFPQRLWQHKQSLKQLSEQLTQLELQASRFSDLSTNPRLLSDFEQRQQQSQTDINIIGDNISQLRDKTDREIRGKISIFAQQQQYTLQQLLLTTRHQMANVLEQMSHADNGSSPIAPTAPTDDTAAKGVR
ncbi:hypothetical protein [Shewanella sp.]|uniref:hypothetical protein n=1 Tax=Shewanella sp. TaxID=50422 RepID=UPI004047B82F